MVDERIPEPDGAVSIQLSPPRVAPVLGVCGGSGAGKSYLVRQLHRRCESRGLRLAHVSFDAYYHDLAQLTVAERSAVNFDHPDSLDSDLFTEHILQLATGYRAKIPLYDFATHTRTGDTEVVGPADVVVLDGILLFAFAAVREAIDLSVYLDVPADLRFDRRLARDTVERGRDVADVERQWKEFVEPMHVRFVEAHAGSADVFVSYGADRDELLDTLMQSLTSVLPESSRHVTSAERGET